MQKLLSTIVFLCIAFALTAQPAQEAEQLREQLKTNPKEDTARIRRLLRLSNISTDIDEKERTAREGIAIAKKINDNTGLYNSLLELADAVTLRDDVPQANRLLDMVDSFGQATGKYGLRAQAAFKRTNIRLTPNTDDALKYYLLAISFAEEDDNLLRLGYYQYCTAILYMTAYNNYQKALEYFLIAEKTAEAGKNNTNLVFVWSGLGDLYTRIGENDKAYSYIRKAYDKHTDTTDIDLTYNLNNSLAKTYELKKQYRESLALFKKNVSISYDPYNIAYAESCVASEYLELDSVAPAFHYAFRALPKMQAMNDTVLLSWLHAVLARAYTKSGNLDSALYYAHKGLDEAKRMNSLESMQNNAELLADIYVKQNDFKNAYTYRELFVNYRDSLHGTEVKNRAAVLNYNNELDKKETRITSLSRQKKLQQYVLISLSAALVLIIVAVIAVLRNNRQKRLALEELKQTQAQLIQAEKMASLGELTAGIAHEIQNPLNFVNNFSEVNGELIHELVDEVDKGNKEEVKLIATDIKQNLDKINQHGKRADAIVKGMLEHSRQGTGQKQLTDINALADEFLKLAYHGLRAKDKEFNSTIKTDFDKSTGKVNIVAQDMGRVLLNVYNNAFYAVKEKQAASRKQHSTPGGFEPVVTVSTKKEGNGVTITVTDNGNGIPQNIIDKIFQPFFTTKPTGQGTGLGLSLAYDIVKAHGGDIKVSNAEGGGASFVIRLPV